MTTLTQPTTLLTPEEYLAAEREAETKSEYVDGVVYPTTGARLRHIVIVGNLTTELNTQLRGRPCFVLPSEMKVRLPDASKFFYPDITVVCDEPQFHDERTDIILNPVLLIEVLSKSTEAFDRGLKFLAYQQFPSLREYLLVAQDAAAVEQFVKQDDGSWGYRFVTGREGSLTLPGVECTLNLGAVYDKVD
ncbi:MAG: Uma2 family endonuclease [Acidobacteriota bacterium]|nr:Uma2 family endonuclease [Acidobacteriota bacterium]